jgi:isopentenyl phosphate kinase
MNETANSLVFLKLGGSLITEKDKPNTPRLDIIRQSVCEIKSVLSNSPGLQLVLGHGSGSFGHSAAHQFGTREGVHNQEGWQGFFRVWQAARELNLIVVEECLQAGLPVIPFPISSGAISSGKNITNWETGPLLEALQHHFIPLVYGDVIFDEILGGTIISTEEIFIHLLHLLQPDKILLAGIEPGIWHDFPAKERIIHKITPQTFLAISQHLGAALATDVTGGMLTKVATMLSVATRYPGIEIQIFSGLEKANITKAILGEPVGTVITKGN